MTGARRDALPDPFRDILGLDVPEDRLAHDLRAYADVLEAIRKLRELDLTDVHPAVVFDPLAGWPEESKP